MITKKAVRRRPVYLLIVDYNCEQDISVFSTLFKAKQELKARLDELIKMGNLVEKPAVIRKRFREKGKMFFDIDKTGDYDSVQYTVHGYIVEKQVW